MKLSDRSVEWLRDLHLDAHTRRSDADLVDSAGAMGLMAHTTPAWIEPYVAVLDQLIERHTGSADNDETDDPAGFMLVLLGIRSMIDTSRDRRRDRRPTTFVLTPGGEAHTEFAELLTECWATADASRMAAEAAGPGARDRLLAAPLEPRPQIVDVDFPNMGLDRAEWIGGNLHLGLAPRVEDATRSTSFRLVGAEPRMWDVHGVENARIESRMSGLHLRVPMVRAEMQLIRSSY